MHVESTPSGHDAVAPKLAIPYFEKRGNTAAAEYLRGLTKSSDSYGEYKGCGKVGSNRQTGGQAITDMIGKIPAAERTKQVQLPTLLILTFLVAVVFCFLMG